MNRPPGLLPELAEYTDALMAIPTAATLADERALWTAFCLGRQAPRPPGLAVEDVSLGLPGRELRARVYRPSPRGDAPCVLYLHGGGWILGDLDTQDGIAAGLAAGSGATLVSLDYRLAPEHRYPAAFEDGLHSVLLLAAEAARFRIDPARIAVCGDSAGGNLAAAVCLALRDRGGPALRAQALVYPSLDTVLPDGGGAGSEVLDASAMRRYFDCYLGPLADDPPPYAMPLRADDLGGLPPALVHTAELDPLRAEGFRFYRRLVAAGNAARYRCARGMVHGFLRARDAGPSTAAEFQAVCDFLREALA